MRKALALLEKEAKESGGGGSAKPVVNSIMRPSSKDAYSKHTIDALSMMGDSMSKTPGGTYKRNLSMHGSVMNSDMMQYNKTTY